MQTIEKINNEYTECLIFLTLQMCECAHYEQYEKAAEFRKLINELNQTMAGLMLTNGSTLNNVQIKQKLKIITEEVFNRLNDPDLY